MNVEFPIAVLLLLCGKNGIHDSVGDRIEAVDLGIQMAERNVFTVLDGDFFLIQPAVDIVEV